MRIFVVEDSPAIRDGLRNMMAGIRGIEQAGEADNEADAVRGITALQPDVLILDLSIIGGSGLEVLRRVREQPSRIRVIVLTNYCYPQYRKRCMQLGADYFLDKSRDIETLAQLLAGMAGAD